MIAQWVLHVEAHRGRWPRVSLRRAPRSGDVVWNGDMLCVLERCEHCGDGFLAREANVAGRRIDRHRDAAGPTIEGGLVSEGHLRAALVAHLRRVSNPEGPTQP